MLGQIKTLNMKCAQISEHINKFSNSKNFYMLKVSIIKQYTQKSTKNKVLVYAQLKQAYASALNKKL